MINKYQYLFVDFLFSIVAPGKDRKKVKLISCSNYIPGFSLYKSNQRDDTFRWISANIGYLDQKETLGV
jgi:hypothetical protein